MAVDSAFGDGFQQDPPRLGNQWHQDHFLKSVLARLLPAEAFREADADLGRFGWEVTTRIKLLGQTAEAQPPRLQKHNAWGRQLDVLITSEAWKQLKAVSAQEGLIALAYERPFGAHTRLIQMAKLHLFGASSGLFNCPLAMTDGAARLCELLTCEAASSVQSIPSVVKDELRRAFSHLTSRDADTFWTSGQWMTEKAGGSDVSGGTETVAVPVAESCSGVGSWFRLHGYKWFTSAADGEMSMALAREAPGGAGNGGGADGGGLTLFYVPIERDECGTPQGIEVVRLKDKLGTRQLPTAELRLRGMRALKISEAGRGVAAIATMVNITRLHNAAAACSYMRRVTALAQDYARRRSAFGRPLIEQPLALRTLAWLELRVCGSLAMMLEVARLLGLQETRQASAADAALLRLLTPLAKLFTAKEAVAVCSEGLEFFGGVGYCEDSHIPVILRDAQVLPIWEGSTNVLSLDLLRVLTGGRQKGDREGGSSGPAAVFLAACRQRIKAAMAAAGPEAAARRRRGESRLGPAVHVELLRRAAVVLANAVDGVQPQLEAAAEAGAASDAAQAMARDLAFAMSKLYIGVLLLEHACWSLEFNNILLAVEWCRQVLLGDSPGGPSAPATECLHGNDDGSLQQGPLDAAAAQLKVAWVLAGAGSQLPTPSAKY